MKKGEKFLAKAKRVLQTKLVGEGFFCKPAEQDLCIVIGFLCL